VTTCRARDDCDVLAIDEAAVHRIVVTQADLSELIMRAFILRRMAMLEDPTGGAMIIGSRLSSDTHRLRQFLTRNGHPHTYLDLERDADTATWLERFGVTAEELPVAITVNGRVLRRPSNRQLADAIGLSPDRLDGRRFDVAVIGAGPAGLAAAVYAASEGLSVVVLDAKAPGGQAGTTSRIENYFGFPPVSPARRLPARFVQAEKFGAEVAIRAKWWASTARPTRSPPRARRRRARRGAHGGHRHRRRYRKLALSNLDQFEGRGVYYAASFMEAQACAGQEVIVVAAATRRVRRLCSSLPTPATSTSWCARPGWRRACPTTSSNASTRRRT